MRIVTVIYSMRCGGAERVMGVLANAWAAQGDRVTVVALNGEPSFYPLLPSVEYRALGVAGASETLGKRLINNMRRVRELRRTVVELRPDVIVSFLDATNVVTLLTTIGLEVPVIVCEHNDPAQGNCNAAWELMRMLSYPLADAVTFLTPSALDQMHWLVGNRGTVMPNPVLPPAEKVADVGAKKDTRTVIAMGRLQPVKGFDYLLEAFHQVAAAHPNWRLIILGEGPLRQPLEQQVVSLGLSTRVEMPGQVRDPLRWLCAADLFVMSSLYEGFPCALCEAMACELPVISFDCPSGPRAIIRGGIDGVLVAPADVDALASAMDELMRNPGERQRLARRAPEILRRFGLEQVLHLWDELFIRVGVSAAERSSPRTREVPLPANSLN